MLALILGFSACDDLTRPGSEGEEDPWFLNGDAALPVAYQQQDTGVPIGAADTDAPLKLPRGGWIACASWMV